ncbi:MAG: hypothetical protein PVH19_00730 [Planctomycetia bacterium]|jgi:squalene-hopene/tetraprenyl-beta-curcumene cyclase
MKHARINAILLIILLVSTVQAVGPDKVARPDRSALVRRLDLALRKAGNYLLEKQADDGAWYSETYGALRRSPALTPQVMSVLLFLPQTGERGQKAYQRGTAYLLSHVKDGKLGVGDRQWAFPVYTAASASRVIAHPKKSDGLIPLAQRRAGQKAYLTYLKQRQLLEPLGWKQSDPAYGGWGFSIGPPKKPNGDDPAAHANPMESSNLAATLFGIGALRSGASLDPENRPDFKPVLIFVQRCQNYDTGDPRFDDGGFFFMPGFPEMNKAGIAGTDRHGHQRMKSYGTMTADGLRALVRAGLPPDHPRVVASRRWLERHFSVTKNPGEFATDRQVLQNATYYYWTWAVAHAFLTLRQPTIDTPDGPVEWPVVLAEQVLRLQRADGSWVNRFTDAKEDDPLIATSWAASTLALCHAMLTHRQVDLFGESFAGRPAHAKPRK